MRRSFLGSFATLSLIFFLALCAVAQVIIPDAASAKNQQASLIAQLPGTITLTRPNRAHRSPMDIGRLNLQPATVGKDLELLAIGSVDVAPKTALPITISSSDPTKLLLSPLSTDPTGVNAGVASFIGTLPAGKGIFGNGFPAFWIHSLASSGTAQITLGAPGYTTATATITLTPSGFVLISPLGTGANFTTQTSAADTNLTVSAAQLDAGGNVVQTDQKLRGGSNVSVSITSGTPATGTLVGAPVSLQGGDSSTALGTLKFHPVGVGTTLLSIAQPNGFTAPVAGGKLTATVGAPSITLTPSVVGYNLQVLGAGALNNPAPNGGLQVNISSSDPTKVLLATDPVAAGSANISVVVPAGTSSMPAFYIQGLASSGTITLTASASGYTNGVANVLLNPSGFVVNSPNNGGDFSTTILSSPTDLEVSAWQLNSSLVPIVAGQIRGGISVPVEVVSGTTSAGTINNGAVTFHSGDYSQTGISFQPNPNCVTPCTSVLSITHPPDFATPASGSQITATVTKPTVTLRLTQTIVGQNLQILGAGALDVPAPSDLPVTVTSNNANVLLSALPTDAGSQMLNLTVPVGSGVNSIGFPGFYIQALSDTGTAQLTVSAPGFLSSNINVTLSPSGFVIEGPNGIGANFGVVLTNGNVLMTVRAAVLDRNTLNPTLLYQAVRGGFQATVGVSSSAPGVATLGGVPLLITSGNLTGTVTFQPQAAGQTTITVTTPTGYTTPSSGISMTATVN